MDQTLLPNLLLVRPVVEAGKPIMACAHFPDKTGFEAGTGRPGRGAGRPPNSKIKKNPVGAIDRRLVGHKKTIGGKG
jgi:hypothetical protein